MEKSMEEGRRTNEFRLNSTDTDLKLSHGPSCFSFKDIGFTVKSGQTILDNVSGSVKAGEVLAILGSSGGGKTTLLNILAHRLAGSNVTGQVLLDGQSLSTGELRALSTYVEQEDALIGALTVRETVDFSVRFSLPKLSKKERRTRVDEMLESFGIMERANVPIGTPLRKGISGGQKRRVSVASQLITLPKIVFLDEPTSGLDSAASFEIISRIKNIAMAQNMIVIASIHQPSTATFHLFSKTLLLSKGKQIYFGSTRQVTSFFDRAGFSIPQEYNPADHMLDITNVDFYPDKQVGMTHIENMSRFWKASEENGELEQTILSTKHDRDHDSGRQITYHPIPTAAQSSVSRQTSVLLHRQLIKAIRDPLAYGVRIVMYLGLALMMGTVWLRLSPTQTNIQNYINALFFGGAFMSFMAVAYIPSYLEDYASFRKERRNGAYGPLAFLVANVLVGVPFIFGISVLFSVVTYFLINFNPSATKFFKYITWLFLDLLAAESLVVLISSLIPLFVGALAVTAFANGLWMCVDGFLVPAKTLNVFWRYTFHQIDYQRYIFEGMMRNEFSNRQYVCSSSPIAGAGAGAAGCIDGLVRGESVLLQYGFQAFKEYQWVIILLSIVLFMRIATYILLRFSR